ncbi:ADP-ribosyl-[dinitrogen reductase] hydrolase [Sphingomonas zeicaulis]|uniref:ADP-ribosylglycohydrolase family protein n=1 Tax=Sphingomonas zeicaulis TaxID=1632740 RepID=UPI003D24A10D
MTTDAPLADRATGALIGLAVGDAIGTTLEFRPRDSAPPLTDMVGGGPFDLAPGQWTDDTSMALALAESLAHCGGFDAADLMTRFVGWWRDGDYSVTGTCFDIGVTTVQALQRFVRDGNPYAGATDWAAAGNGSLMRLAPVAIWGIGAGEAAMRKAARNQSATTHGTIACLDACEGFAVVLHALFQGAGFEDALARAGDLDTTPEVGAIFRGCWRRKGRDDIRSSGYVVHSLEAAVWSVANSRSFEEAVLRAANLGDDADTVAAITGQLAGALHGHAAIPVAWRDRIAWRDRLEAAAGALLG